MLRSGRGLTASDSPYMELSATRNEARSIEFLDQGAQHAQRLVAVLEASWRIGNRDPIRTP